MTDGRLLRMGKRAFARAPFGVNDVCRAARPNDSMVIVSTN